MIIPEALQSAARKHPYPLMFATISGAHLYGFPSPDSDYDLRGVHILPAEDFLGLTKANETVQVARKDEEIDLDLVTHDAKKFFLMMLKPNGYVLEQLHSPLVVQTSPEHEELRSIGKSCVTRSHSHHYLGFARNQWRLFEKESPPRVKPLLYIYRVLLTAINLMRTGLIEANLSHLNDEFGLPYIDELIERKRTTTERQVLTEADVEFHRREYERLEHMLEESAESSRLPESPSAEPALNDLLKKLRTCYN